MSIRRAAVAVAVEHATERRPALVVLGRIEHDAAGSPASIAGLPASRAWVWVGPPLLASGPSWGLFVTTLLPPAVGVIPVPIRL